MRSIEPEALPVGHEGSILVSKDGFPSGGGEMGGLIRAFDWSKTSLGPIA